MSRFASLRDHWAELSALLDEALALPAGQREAWLAALDGPRKAHVGTLSGLLAAAPGVETDSLLSALPHFVVDDGKAGPAGPAADDLVGPYRLLSPLGQGGMGSVWLAERTDGMPKRKVALKLPYIGWAPGLAQRLARERDILASLEHPHIARLYDAGLDALGRPYLALEYVDGTPIDRWCTEHHAPLAERLRLLLQVASAVAHAHTRLVVHRDLKPSNILVDGNGDVRLLDFGVARLIEGEGSEPLTRAGIAPLTPDYASPEQMLGRPAGTPSDVYSLGVVAYELLAGDRPYRLNGTVRQDASRLAEALLATEVAPPSRTVSDPDRARRLRGDLDAIVGKALKKDPDERYPTVTAFADDIRRHLAHEPVAAQPDRFAYRAQRFVARHALPIAGGSAIAVALLAGAGVALWQAREARLEAERAQQVKNFALSIFADADTDSGAGAATTAVDLLKAARARLAVELRDRPDVAVELMTSVGYALIGQGSYEDGAAVAKDALDLAARHLPPGDPRRLAAATVYGEGLFELDRHREAVTLLAPVIDEARRQHDVRALVDALRWTGSARLALGELDAAVASAQASVDAVMSAQPPAPASVVATAWLSLANARSFAQRPGAADAARTGIEWMRKAQGDRMSMQMLDARRMYASALAHDGQARESIAELESVLALTRELGGDRHSRVELSANLLANARLQAGDAEGAAAAFRAAIAAAEARHAPPYGQAIEHYGLGAALAAARRDADALPELDAAIRAFEAAGPSGVPLGLRSRSVRALSLARLGRLDAAEREFVALDPAPWSGLDGLVHQMRLAELRGRQGRHDQALALATRAAAALPADAPALGRAQFARVHGMALLAAGRAADAAPVLQRAIALYSAQQIVESADRREAAEALGRAQAGSAASAPAASATAR